MDILEIRDFVRKHPEGVRIRMTDGKQWVIPHPDWVWFTPATGKPESEVGYESYSFYVAEEGVGHLVNAKLVAEVTPLDPGNPPLVSRNGRS